MKKYSFLHFFAVALPLLCMLMLAVPTLVGAAGLDYLLVDDIPFIRNLEVKEGESGLALYFQNIFRLGVGLAVTFAIFMLVLNGIRYMISDITGEKTAAREGMFNAVIGLLIIFGSVLVLNTINPELTKFRLVEALDAAVQAAREGRTANPQSPGFPPDAATAAEERRIRDRLADANIDVNKGGCATPQETSCTNLSDLPAGTIERLIALQASCANSDKFTSCVYITGGAEAGHETHGPGLPMVDLDKTSGLTAYIKKNGGTPVTTCLGPLYSYGGSEYLEESDHWHACMGTTCRFSAGCKQ